jgi:hypothetical protein
MNIEEERKAFEATMIKVIADKAHALYGEGASRAVVEESARKHIAGLDEEESLFSVHFAMWLAAKAHAEEMAKPACNVWETMSNEWRACDAGEYRDILGERKHHATRAAAVAYAEQHGYRVVEE